MIDSLSIVLPVRKGSKRVKNKNTRRFGGFKNGLLELKLEQLVNVNGAREIIVSSNDGHCIDIAERYKETYENIIVDRRPDYLAEDDTDLAELISYFGSIVNSNHILWTHATSPFVDANIYRDMIDKYFNVIHGDYDSLMSVKTIQNFIWDEEKGDLINREGKLRWPRTQDLRPLYEINSAVFITSRETYKKAGDRVGRSPYLFKLNGLVSIDIDWELDFKIAEILYEAFHKRKV